MNEKKFWKLISKSKSLLLRRAEHQQARLIRLLVRCNAQDIELFEIIFQFYLQLAHTWDLRAVAHIIHGGCTDEEFEDFKAWLIMRGRKTFFRVLRKPDSISKYIKPRDTYVWEGFLHCALEAYETKIGLDFPETNRLRGVKWEEPDLPVLFPRLWKRFIESD